ncbi:MAG: hypothetical protein AAGN46_00205 [Acidobacteriota bacterium]
MKLNAPTQAVWILAVILGVLGILGFFGVVAPVAGYSFWLVMIAFVLLAMATVVRGM